MEHLLINICIVSDPLTHGIASVRPVMGFSGDEDH